MTPQAPAPAMDWQASAACGGTNSHAFYKAKPSEAKAICAGCPVRAECLYDAVDTDVTDGIWGGYTRQERRALPVLPTDRTAALNVLRQILAPADAEPDPVPSRSPARRKKPAAKSKPQAVPVPREDVAELLRQGRTQVQVMAELKVSHEVVVASREAYGVPRRTGPGFRYSPERRAENERRTIELLRGGATHQQVTDEVGISPPTIVAICRKAGLPTNDHRGGQPARPRAEVLAESVEAYGEGHARWMGGWAGRNPQLNAEGLQLNARRVAFEQHHGRPPTGRVFSGCGVTGCIAGAHLTDQTLRAARPKEEPVTVQALKNLLDEIDEEGGPQAARDNRLHLAHHPSDERTPQPVATAPVPEPHPTQPDPLMATADVRLKAAPAFEPEGLSVGQLLKWGDEHPDPEVQDQAARGRAILTGLRNRHSTDEELTALATQREQLEKQLAELTARQAELAPAKKAKRKASAVVRDYDSRTVRAWADENGIDCPHVGKVPKRVLDAWRSATAPAGGAG